ncbi:MAG: POTRA domain-containing protein, partial [Bacteroidota bacterium]
MRIGYVFLTIALWCLSLPAWGQKDGKIASIQFQGLKKSKPDYLQRFLKCAVGRNFSEEALAEDVQMLRNLQVFQQVEGQWEQKENGIRVLFDVVERITIFPYVNFGGVRGNQYVQLGMTDYHFLGKGGQLGGYYRYDGRNTFYLFNRQPFINKGNWGYQAGVLRLATREPLFFNGVRLNYL